MALEVDEVGVDDDREPQLVEVDLLAQDQVEQEVERALEHRGLHLVGHGAVVNDTGVVRVNGLKVSPAPLRSPAMARVFSGIQPTGDLHLGNYLGAVRRWVAEQHHRGDLLRRRPARPHGPPRPRRAAGQDPRPHPPARRRPASTPTSSPSSPRATCASTPSCRWIMECTAAFGELRRMTQWKDKSERAEFVSAGLFTYPALQAADILLYDTDEVPVGDDQRQHLELARDLAIRFNGRYGDDLRGPQGTSSRRSAPGSWTSRTPPARCRSRSTRPRAPSRCSTTRRTIEKKVKRAVTDSDGEVRVGPRGQAGGVNLLSILGASTGAEARGARRPLRAVRPAQGRHRRRRGRGCCAPCRSATPSWPADPGAADAILATGAAKARTLAEATMVRVREAVGLLPARPDRRQSAGYGAELDEQAVGVEHVHRLSRAAGPDRPLVHDLELGIGGDGGEVVLGTTKQT